MALSAPAPTPMQNIALLFRNGRTAKFRAERFTLTRSVTTGEMTDLKWEGLVGPQPMFIDWDEVIAVAIEIEDPAGSHDPTNNGFGA